jgi:hypothetical protein
MLLNLTAEIAIGFIEVFLITHTFAFDIHNRLLTTHLLLELSCKLDDFKLAFFQAIFLVCAFEYTFNQINKLISLVYHFKIIFFFLPYFLDLRKKR